MTFRVGVDGYNLAMPHGTGVASYGAALVQTLRTMGCEVTGVFGIDVRGAASGRETLFFDRLQQPVRRRQSGMVRWANALLRPLRPVALEDVPLTDLVEKRGLQERFPTFDRLTTRADLFAMADRHFRKTGRFTTVRMIDPPAIMHWTYPVPVRLAGARNIYTIHDLVPLKIPYATADDKRYYRRLIAACLAQADRICTISEASRADILAQFGIAADQVTNCYQTISIGDAAEDDSGPTIVEGLFTLPDRGYFLFYGAIEPKKNVQRLLEAYLSLDTKTPLVVVGRAWAGPAAAMLPDGMLGDSRFSERIVRLEYLPRRVLLQLIRRARAVVFPSLYEGFGLPVLEAMTLGTPILTSNVSAMPEIAGSAGLLVDPYDVVAIADGLRRLDDDAGLRDNLVRAGRDQALRFGASPYRERLGAMYAAVLNQATR